MNKLKKLVVLAVVIVGVILFIYPKPFKQTYKDVQVYENGNKVSKLKVIVDYDSKEPSTNRGSTESTREHRAVNFGFP